MISDIISGRATSSFPLSVGTSLAFESAILTSDRPSIDPERKIPQKVNLSDFDEVWINISTLFRNLYGSLTKDDSLRVHPRELSRGLVEEIEFIQSLVATETLNKTKVIFYICEYRDLNKKYPEASFRTINTDKQKVYKAIHDQSIQGAISHFGKVDFIKIFNSEITTQNYKTAIFITHIAHDLLSNKNFRDMQLLESHTGVLKKQHHWHTKYENGKHLTMLPFNKFLLQVFGDSEHFRPFPIRVRNSLLELAEKNMWTTSTTMDKIKYGVSNMPDHFTREVLLKMF